MPERSEPFTPALIIVDPQEDFCPPNGSLAVQDGRAIAEPINTLLALPFTLRVATRDFHPANHVSFASAHPGAKPFETILTITNPLDTNETQESRAWPDHCVQGTPGAEIIPELDASRFTHVVDKGMDARVEMYSAFYDPFRVSVSKLPELLKEGRVTDVYAVGLAMDYCVKATALDALGEGYRVWVVSEGTKAVDPSGWKDVQDEMEGKGVRFVGIDGEEVDWVRKL
ncbi:Isochorismatase hydrolase [Peniophora sp. CONT]|nr:Isochorismatase hydrolase [Peniophora sp. CONT]